MDISVTEFKHHCLEIIRRVEKTGKPVAITRRGKVVVRLNPSGSAAHGGLKPWEQLRALGGRLLAEPGESVLRDEDFEALRRIVSRRSGRPAHRRNRLRARDAARGP